LCVRITPIALYDAKLVSKTPHLAKNQAETGSTSRITRRVDNDVLASLKVRLEQAIML
jgi:hypothetical protein